MKKVIFFIAVGILWGILISVNWSRPSVGERKLSLETESLKKKEVPLPHESEIPEQNKKAGQVEQEITANGSSECALLRQQVLSHSSLQMFALSDQGLNGHELERAESDLADLLPGEETVSSLTGCKFPADHPVRKYQKDFETSCESVISLRSKTPENLSMSIECLRDFFIYKASLINYETKNTSVREILDPGVLLAKIYVEKIKFNPSQKVLSELGEQLVMLSPQYGPDLQILLTSPGLAFSGDLENSE